VSSYRDLKNAQQALNEAVGQMVWAVGAGATFDETGSEISSVCDAYEVWDKLRKQYDGDRPAVASDTSIAAAKTRPLLAGSLRRRVVEAVVAQWKLYQSGLTTDQLEGRFRRSHQSVSSAVNDMMTKGWLKDSGERRQTRSNCKAMVLIPTDLALANIDEEH
jgi:hypothetical protein